MAGVKGRSGGARPGAGVKNDETVRYQASRRGIVQEVVTPERWRQSVEAMLGQIREGNVKAFAVLAPYVMGAAPKEVTVRGDAEHPMVFVVE